MDHINDQLQKLIGQEAQKKYTHQVLLSVKSEKLNVNFKGSAGDAMHTDDTYFIASITKLFTATVIMQMVDEQKLSLEDLIDQHLPDLDLNGIHVHKGVDYSHKLTVKHLLHQTSGLADYFNGGLVEDFKQNKDQAYDIKQVIEMARNAKPFAKPDAGQSHYSDTNFQLLSAIIESIAKQPLATVFHERIFAPLKMKNSYLFDPQNPRESNPIAPYFKNTKLILPQATASEKGAGGAVSNMHDLLLFLPSFFGGELFHPQQLDKMMQWNRMFFPMQYGYGIWRYQLPRWLNLFRETPEFIGHAGVWGAMAFYHPKKEVFIVGTLNQLHQTSRQFSFMHKVLNILEKG